MKKIIIFSNYKMSFKLSNTSFEQSKRIIDITLATSSVEHFSSTGTCNPYIPTTEVVGGIYTITLPTANPGTQKIITLTQGTSQSVTIAYNNAWNGEPNSQNLYDTGDTVVCYATSSGWHMNRYILD